MMRRYDDYRGMCWGYVVVMCLWRTTNDPSHGINSSLPGTPFANMV